MNEKSINDNKKLYEYLVRYFGDRFVLEDIEDINTTGKNAIFGKLDSIGFYILFQSDFNLILEAEPNGRDIIKELAQAVKRFLNVDPIIKYDIKYSNKDELFPVIEWNFADTKERYGVLANNKAFVDDVKIYNPVLSNGDKLEDYKDINERRIPGIYPGCIDKIEEVNNLDEARLYMALVGNIWNLQDLKKQNPYIDISELGYAVEYLMYQTTRFGVTFDKPEAGKHIEPNKYYDAWYEFYTHHFFEELTPEQMGRLSLALKNGEDISEFLPEGDWTDSLVSQPNLSLLN